MNDSVQYERAGAIGYVTLNRPSVLNAMNDALLEGVAASLQSAHDDHEAHVVVVRGAGRAFCAGADLNDTPRRLSLDEYRRSRLELERDVAR
ncbi:MAG: enoyl-CoA hydratase/isomerase family protein, partial [Burkholderiales bacterium]